jgi:hypothetical protein
MNTQSLNPHYFEKKSFVRAWLLVIGFHAIVFLCLLRINNVPNVKFRESSNSGVIPIYSLPVKQKVDSQKVDSVSNETPILKTAPRAIVESKDTNALSTPLRKENNSLEIKIGDKDEIRDESPTDSVLKGDAVRQSTETNGNDTKAIELNKAIISEASRAQQRLDRERKILGISNEREEQKLAVQIQKSAKPDCLKPPANADATNNASNLVVLLSNIVQDKCLLR